MLINVGPYRVYHSGTVVLPLNSDASFSIHDLTYVFTFKDDISNTEARVNFVRFANGKGFTMEMINFNNSLGTGNTEPYEVGYFNSVDLYKDGQTKNYKLYILYRIYHLNEKMGKTIHYTWYTQVF